MTPNSQPLFSQKFLIKCRNFSQENKKTKKGNLIQLKFVEIRHKKRRERRKKKFTQSYFTADHREEYGLIQNQQVAKKN